jgi:ABC-type amino acid transport system permease subunit
MSLLQSISNAFINTMGITKPSPRAEKRAAWFIVTLLSAVAAAIVAILFLALHYASHARH